MVTVTFPEYIRVSHSRIRSWRRCQMQHYYRYNLRLQRKTKSRPLMVGSAVHELLEAWHERGNFDQELEAFTAEYNKLFNEEKAELGDLPTLVREIVEGYQEFYREDHLVFPKRRRGRSTELYVETEILPGIVFVGYIDAFPTDENGRNWVLDRKTARNIPDEDTRFSDLQLLTYCWLLPQAGYPKPDGVIWDYLRTKPPSKPEKLARGGFSQNKNIDTTEAVYRQTLIEAGEDVDKYEDFLESLRGKEGRFYRRIHLPAPSEAMIENVVGDLKLSAREIQIFGKEACIRNMTRDCSRMCSYYNLCSAEVRGLDSEFIIKKEFTTKEQRDEEKESEES